MIVPGIQLYGGLICMESYHFEDILVVHVPACASRRMSGITITEV